MYIGSQGPMCANCHLASFYLELGHNTSDALIGIPVRHWDQSAIGATEGRGLV